ncbi:hypothetical protein GUITHDRAFT_131802 [Guillardia theta CCMP2712]|uniref:Uncharacterized protein n=1 Tax=Guillardia theta (strain CCMP2712) TaxID=905079 RepID=L1K1V2_GUITC|nr:hypothetical protein GUITHDRAFT_131802 [Guillardia theta CCMP2712]EKX54791.1 hypothetical protein GUITHDRAFT_131802 [Guillardia theta CCMP2712]|eukprot:XP_005841771.1 hypothetical protein GUITHDRAFT_131802 [Guillardia theta CCMP2712]
MPISAFLFTLVCSIWLQPVTGGTLLPPGQLPALTEEGRGLRASHVLVGTVRRSTSTAVRIKFVLDVSNVQPDRAASDFNILGGEIASSLTLTRSAVSLVSQFAAGTTTWQIAYEVSTTRDVAEKVSSQIKKSLDSPSLSAFIRSKGWRVGFYSYPAMYDEANLPLRITADDSLTAAFVAKVIVPVCAITALLIFLILYFHLVEQVEIWLEGKSDSAEIDPDEFLGKLESDRKLYREAGNHATPSSSEQDAEKDLHVSSNGWIGLGPIKFSKQSADAKQRNFDFFESPSEENVSTVDGERKEDMVASESPQEQEECMMKPGVSVKISSSFRPSSAAHDVFYDLSHQSAEKSAGDGDSELLNSRSSKSSMPRVLDHKVANFVIPSHSMSGRLRSDNSNFSNVSNFSSFQEISESDLFTASQYPPCLPSRIELIEVFSNMTGRRRLSQRNVERNHSKNEEKDFSRQRILDLHNEVLGTAGSHMTDMERLPGDKGALHYQGAASLTGRMFDSTTDNLPPNAKLKRVVKSSFLRDEDEMWG